MVYFKISAYLKEELAAKVVAKPVAVKEVVPVTIDDSSYTLGGKVFPIKNRKNITTGKRTSVGPAKEKFMFFNMDGELMWFKCTRASKARDLIRIANAEQYYIKAMQSFMNSDEIEESHQAYVEHLDKKGVLQWNKKWHFMHDFENVKDWEDWQKCQVTFFMDAS